MLTGGLVALIMLFNHQAIALFLGDDSDAVGIGEHIINVATWGFIPFVMTMVLFATIRANGQVVWPLIVLFVAMFPIRLGVAYGFMGTLGADAIWLSFPAAMLATMVMGILLYRFGNWRNESDMELAAGQPASQPAALSSEACPPGSPTTANSPPLGKRSAVIRC